MPNSSWQNFSSSTVSLPWVCSRTPLRRANSAASHSSSVETENGEQGATAMCSIEPNDASWWVSTAASVASSAPSVLSTAKSGGSPPSLLPRSIEPRAAVKRTPSSAAALISAPSRSPAPRGKT